MAFGARSRRADDRHATAAEDLVEAAAELAIADVEEEVEGLLPILEEHQQVPRLLCDPVNIRIGRARDELDPAALERDEEEDIDARQPDAESVASVDPAWRLRADET